MTRKMKDSGIEWIGEIPEDWSLFHLKYICTFKTGGTPSNKKGIDIEGDYMWVTPSDINNTFVISRTKQYINESAIRNYGYSLYPPNSILLVCIASVGKVGITNYKAYSNQQITALKIYKKAHPKYLLYTIVAGSDQISFDASSNVIPIVNTKYLENFNIAIPNYSIQQKISKFLDAKCAEIDKLTADIQSEIETLKAYKRSVITEAVTKGLDRNVAMKNSGVEWIGDIPKEWNVNKIKYIAHSRTIKYKLSDVGKYIGLENVESSSGHYIDTGTEYEDGYYDGCEQGDLLYGKLRPNLEKVLLSPFKACCTGEFEVISYSTIGKKYLQYYMLTDVFTQIVTASTYGSKMPRANWSFIENLNIVYPNSVGRKVILKFLDTKCAEIDAIISYKQEQLTILSDYKKSLIYEYVTGKKEVPVP